MLRWLIVSLSIGTLAVSGLAHGLLTFRWVAAEESIRAVARLEQVPSRIGEFECKDAEMDKKPQDRVAAQMLRRYVNQRTGASVSVWATCGRPGPLSIHTPDWCYRASGYEMVSSKTKATLTLSGSTDKAEFWTADFTRTRPTGTENLRVYWGWNAGKGWEAAESPRLAYTRVANLYKLYFVCSLDAKRQLPDDDGILQFIQDFLPELERFRQ
jgi:hypothetical protein